MDAYSSSITTAKSTKYQPTKPLTDKEIYDAAFKEWVGVLQSLWVAIGKPVDNERLRLYIDVFRPVPLGLLEKAVRRVQLTTTYQVVPTIAEINNALRAELSDANCIDYDNWVDQCWRGRFWIW